MSIMLLNGKVCEHKSVNTTPLSHLNDVNNLGTIELRKVCSCAPVFNFVSMPMGGANTKCLSWKCTR